MGYWYWRELKHRAVLDESATNTFDMPEKGHVSGLMVTLEQVNATYLCNGYADPYPVQKTSIRILGNGNEQITNAKASHIEAHNFWDTGEMSRRLLWTITGQLIPEEIFIPFGRWFGDEKYGLILDKFAAGVQFEESNTYSTSYVTDGSQRISVRALMRKDPEAGLFSGGYMSLKQVANEVSANRTKFAVKLPTRNKLRQIYLFSVPDPSSTVRDTTAAAAVPNVWLSIKSREEYLIDDLPSGGIAYDMHRLYGRVARTGGLSGAGATTCYIDTKLGERQETLFSSYNTTPGAFVEDAGTNLEQIAKVYTYDLATPSLAARQFYWSAKGIQPHGLVPLLMQDQKSDSDKWLDAAANGDVYVEFSEGTAAYSRCYIVLNELQKHPET